MTKTKTNAKTKAEINLPRQKCGSMRRPKAPSRLRANARAGSCNVAPPAAQVGGGSDRLAHAPIQVSAHSICRAYILFFFCFSASRFARFRIGNTARSTGRSANCLLRIISSIEATSSFSPNNSSVVALERKLANDLIP